MNNDLMFSSKTDKWATPQDFFDKLNNEFKFQLDVCADENNHKCARFFTKEQDGLLQEWGGGKGMVQSTLRQGCRRMGQEMFKMRLSRDATSRKDGHEMVSRIHLWESGNPICAWSPKIRKSRKLGTVPFNGSGF